MLREEYASQQSKACKKRATLVAVMIEEVTDLENLDETLKVSGLDSCGIGPGDLFMSMGYPGQPDHPDVQAQRN